MRGCVGRTADAFLRKEELCESVAKIQTHVGRRLPQGGFGQCERGTGRPNSRDGGHIEDVHVGGGPGHSSMVGPKKGVRAVRGVITVGKIQLGEKVVEASVKESCRIFNANWEEERSGLRLEAI